MVMDTLLVYAATYADVDDAVADYDAVNELWATTTLGDTFDAAVITRRADGKVKIVKRHEQPTIQGGEAGLGIGLAVGALTAVLPAVAIGAGLVLGGAAGAGLGAVAGHVVAGMSRSDLKELGELLDAGQSGLLVVAAQDTEARVDAAITRGEKQLKTQLRADERDLEAALDESVRAATA